MADDDALIAYRLNIPINELTPADRERYASMRSRMVPRRVAERQQMLREREAQRRQSRANDPERDALIAYRLGIPANELTDADRARYESQRGFSLFGRSTPQAQPQPRSPFRQAIDTTVRNLGAVGGIMNPALSGQLERQLIGRSTPPVSRPRAISDMPAAANIPAGARASRTPSQPQTQIPTAGAGDVPGANAPTLTSPRMREIDMQAQDVPGNRAMSPPPSRRSRPAPSRPRETSADDLNAISLAFARGERPRGGAADTIGKALGIEGYKKGGRIGTTAPRPQPQLMPPQIARGRATPGVVPATMRAALQPQTRQPMGAMPPQRSGAIGVTPARPPSALGARAPLTAQPSPQMVRQAVDQMGPGAFDSIMRARQQMAQGQSPNVMPAQPMPQQMAQGQMPQVPPQANGRALIMPDGRRRNVFKKGGMVAAKEAAPKVTKKAMGGMIKAPKKPAVPGRGRGRPATAVKAVSTKPMAKAAKPKMPVFKKGGSVSMKKGKK